MSNVLLLYFFMNSSCFCWSAALKSKSIIQPWMCTCVTMVMVLFSVDKRTGIRNCGAAVELRLCTCYVVVLTQSFEHSCFCVCVCVVWVPSISYASLAAAHIMIVLWAHQKFAYNANATAHSQNSSVRQQPHICLASALSFHPTFQPQYARRHVICRAFACGSERHHGYIMNVRCSGACIMHGMAYLGNTFFLSLWNECAS